MTNTAVQRTTNPDLELRLRTKLSDVLPQIREGANFTPRNYTPAGNYRCVCVV